MALVLPCPSCSSTISIPSGETRKVRCPSCRAVITPPGNPDSQNQTPVASAFSAVLWIAAETVAGLSILGGFVAAFWCIPSMASFCRWQAGLWAASSSGFWERSSKPWSRFTTCWQPGTGIEPGEEGEANGEQSASLELRFLSA